MLITEAEFDWLNREIRNVLYRKFPTALRSGALARKLETCKKKLKFDVSDIKQAVKDWVAHRVSAEVSYGHISGWDTSEMTDTSSLF